MSRVAARGRLALLAGVAAAAAFVPAPSASAVCVLDLSAVGGPSCYNPCGTAYQAYRTADRAAHDVLNDHLFECLM